MPLHWVPLAARRSPGIASRATLVAVVRARIPHSRANLDRCAGYVHLFVPFPSERKTILRTHVLFCEIITAWAARARCPSPHPLVPAARGRLRGRLGGRPGRVARGEPSAPSAAAWASAATASGHARAACACLPLPRGWRQRPENDDGSPYGDPCLEKTGGVLLSQALAGQVPSALRGLTALFGMGRGVSPSLKPPEKGERPASPVLQNCTAPQRVSNYPSSPRPISTGLLQTLPSFQIRPINLVVYQGSYSLKGMGEFILRPASRLDAFSGYPIHT
jgi:hypothetical protein